MSYSTKALKTALNSKPAAQQFNVAADDYSVLRAGIESSDTITRPSNSTQYAAGDVISTAAGEVLEFPNCGEANDLFCIMGISVMIAQNAVPAGCAGFTLHIYTSLPTAIADNAAYNLPAGDRAKRKDSIDLAIPRDLGDTVVSDNHNLNHTLRLAGTSLFGILTTRGTDVPTSGAVYTVTMTGKDL